MIQTDKVKKVLEAAIQFGNEAVVKACHVIEGVNGTKGTTLDEFEFASKVVDRYYFHWNLGND